VYMFLFLSDCLHKSPDLHARKQKRRRVSFWVTPCVLGPVATSIMLFPCVALLLRVCPLDSSREASVSLVQVCRVKVHLVDRRAAVVPCLAAAAAWTASTGPCNNMCKI